MSQASEREWIDVWNGVRLYDVLPGPKVPPEVRIGDVARGKCNDPSEEDNHEDAPKIKNAPQRAPP